MRNMSVEYLRVVFISFIVLLHILWKDYGGLYGVVNSQSANPYIQLGLTNLVTLGVTGFILISGFYGVKLKISRIVSLGIQTFFYALLSAILIKIFWGGNVFKKLIDTPLSLFDGDWWFVTDYLILMLLSPFLNAGLEKIDKKTLAIVIAILSFIMYGAEWLHAKDSSMPLLLFFNTYLIGRYIRLYPIMWLDRNRYWIFILGLVTLVSEPLILHAIGLDSKMKFVSGNFNLLIPIIGVVLLLICNSHQKQGNGNFLTKNILAVYLIHESGVGRKLLHECIFYEGREFNLLFILMIVILVVLSCALIEEARKIVMGKMESIIICKVESLLKMK